ncbi:helix-turn-helix domain-containing protein [Heyndrickxia ginsengihumi]|uniref:helix-turn-helix domain-containing protein n=1 Tax=Heyndrickxia ginsengihumi TaxID=363870 RepID=UPI00046E69C4|nr:helix-turn-helix domain-containing protein [Heyndrickxia ginsengihumi]
MQFYSVEEVARKLGLSITTVKNMSEKGRFKGAFQTNDGEWLIPVDIFITSPEQDEKAHKILKHLDEKNRKVDNKIEFIDAQLVADYYGTTLKEVKRWIKQGAISGKQSEEDPDRYLIPKEEFEYLKERREKDDTEEAIQELLGDEFTAWDVEFDD